MACTAYHGALRCDRKPTHGDAHHDPERRMLWAYPRNPVGVPKRGFTWSYRPTKKRRK
jgi:hypothetical protein